MREPADCDDARPGCTPGHSSCPRLITDAVPCGEIVSYPAVHRNAEDAIRRTLSYVDDVAFARRASAHFGAGLRDTACPPSTVFAAYHHYTVANEVMYVYQLNHHEGGAAIHVRRQVRWLGVLLA